MAGGHDHWLQQYMTMPMQQLQDDECVALCQRGNNEAFGELVRRYQNRVYHFILRMTSSREEALELTQDTLLKAFQHLPTWRPEASFRTWLFRIASNTTMDVLRRRKLVEYVPMVDDVDFPDLGEGPEAQLQTRQSHAMLKAALSRLPHELREILLLREFEDMPYEEISAALGICEGTVKSRLARARKALLSVYEYKKAGQQGNSYE